MSQTGNIPPGAVFTKNHPNIIISTLTVSRQDGIVPGDVVTISCTLVPNDWINSRILRVRVSAVATNKFFEQEVSLPLGSSSFNFDFTNPVNGFAPGREGALIVDVGTSNLFNDIISIPMNAGFTEPGNGGGLVFGDLSSSVSVSNVTQTGAMVTGTITNNTSKTGTIGIFVSVRDMAGIEIQNNAPVQNQVIAASGTLQAALIASGLQPNTQYEARVFALDETHTVALSPIASTTFTTTETTPGPQTLDATAMGEPLAGPSPLTVTFSSMVTGGVPPYSYSWVEVISGQPYSNSPGFTATFENIGDYIMLLSVSDSAQNTDTAEVRFTVDNQLPPPPPPGASGFGLIALPLFMGAIAYVWPPEEERKRRYSRIKAAVSGGIRASKREIEKAGRYFIREVNRR